MSERAATQVSVPRPAQPAPKGLLQRACACGGHAGLDGECAACRKKRLQRRLAIGASSNRYEREADAIAARAMAGSPPPQIGRIALGTLQRAAELPETGAARPSVDAALAGAGQPLDPATRGWAEARLGHDFGRVRVHTGPVAARSARAVGALAYTVGQQIVFGAGQYRPHALEGRRLLAHELTHTVQQHGSCGKALVQRTPKPPGISVAPVAQAAPGGVSPEFNEPGWSPVDRLGVLYKIGNEKASDNGANLHRASDDTAELIGHLPENTKVHVVSEKNRWYFVNVVDKRPEIKKYHGAFGYLAEWLVWLDPPDPDAEVYFISTKGEGLQRLVENHPKYASYDIRTGDDARSLVLAVLLANGRDKRTKDNVYLNPEKQRRAQDVGAWERTKDALDPYRSGTRVIFQSVELRYGTKIWLPGLSYISMLKGKNIIPSRPDWMNTAVAITRGVDGFISGLVDGFTASIIDVFVGIYDLIKGIISTIRSIITGDAIRAAKEIYALVDEMSAEELWTMLKDALSSMLSDILGDIKRNWNLNNVYKQWHFRGKVLGYILAEVLMAIFSGGATMAGKVLGRLGKLGRALERILSKAFRRVDRALDRVPGRTKRRHDTGKADVHKGDSPEQARELPFALASARAIAETHDARDDPVELAIASLQLLRAKFSWVKGFSTKRKGRGRYQIILHASTHIVDEEYTEKVSKEVDDDVERSFRKTFDEGTQQPPVQGPPAPTQSPEVAAGFKSAHLRAIGRLLGKRLTSGYLNAHIGRLWRSTTNAADVSGLNLANSRRLFNNHRRRFWNAVRRDDATRTMLEEAGFKFVGKPGSAPVYRTTAGRYVRVTIDHIIERQTAPERALDPDNLQLVFTRENTVVLRQLHQQSPFLFED